MRSNFSSFPLLALLFTATTAFAYSVADNNNHHVYCAAGDKVYKQPFPDSVLKKDHYQGVTIKLESLVDDQKHLTEPEHFATALEQALKVWEAEGKRGIWIHIPNSMASLVPECANLGFRFHFCQSGVLTMTKWLPKDTPSRLPLGPSLQAGVGIVVLHPKDPNLILTVQEKAGPAAAYKLWKMPTGLVDPGEDMMEASIRELKEETGLDATFEGVLCFLQSHRGTGNRATSDMFFICHLTITSDPDDLKPQESEIADIRWMPFSQYASQETWKKSPVYMELHEAVKEGIAQRNMIQVQQVPVGWTAGNSTVYRPKP